MTYATSTITVKELKQHTGPILAWINVFEHDGIYSRVYRADLLRQLGADVPHRDGGLHDDTPIRGRISSDGALYID